MESVNKIEQFLRVLAPTRHQLAQPRGDTMKRASHLLTKQLIEPQNYRQIGLIFYENSRFCVMSKVLNFVFYKTYTIFVH